MLRTFEVAKRAHAQKLRREVERDPFVAAVLKKFPGAEIVGVNEVPAGDRLGAPEGMGGSESPVPSQR